MPDDVEFLMNERKLDEEDLKIQLEEALRSFKRGHYACACAELRGAIYVLEKIKKQRER